MVEKFPEVQGGGSLILAWQVKHKKVLVIGGGEVSLWKSSIHVKMVDINSQHRSPPAAF
jgi:hypothetical protein